ncbi:MAG TPA: hypothetical protein DHV36_01745 [Desulfobacteraceae bacterium]|nr:hypothetical protein [Desulfobacteraceae bacterium]|tara:strand:- start:2020 stop:2466 length:447 start_codon:yes stop_codon:yes gene_type:complete
MVVDFSWKGCQFSIGLDFFFYLSKINRTCREFNMENHIPLDRQFSPVPRNQEEAEKNEILSAWGHVKPKNWTELDDEFRCVMARCGVMLLVWQGRKPLKKWLINKQRIGLKDLATALKGYWYSIADQYPGVDTIEVVAIDLTIRQKLS